MRLRLVSSTLLAAVLLTSCAGAPKPRSVRKPLWNFLRPPEFLMAANVASAATAWDQLQKTRHGGKKHAEAEAAYERAVTHVIRTWDHRQAPKNWSTGSYFEFMGRSFTIDLQPAPGHPQEVSPLMFDRLRIAADVGGHSLVKAAEEGHGVPVVGQVLRSPELAAQYPMMPLNGGHLTLTAILEFDPPPASKDTPRRARLHLYNPLRKPVANVAGEETKLAADYTAPKQLALNDGFLKRFSFLGLLMPGKMLEDSRLYRLELYDPNRIPVVFVHGLMSDPHIWFNCINAIYADPVLRARYQPWYFLYPTGLAVPSTSKRLRDSLTEARETLDPDHNDPGMNKTVLVGHSMGGLLSRMQVIDSGDSFWSAFFQCKPEELRVSENTRKRMVDTLTFSKLPFIQRLIFIATPHQGSSMADRGIVYWLSSLIRLPLDSLLMSKELISGNTDSLSPQIRDWGVYGFLSLGSLSPKHPYLKALNAQPIPVPHHSIIGRVGRPGLPLAETNDRVVPYTSSHLPTGTEDIVPLWHGCVEQQVVIDHVLRRLHQHLRENGIHP